MSNVLLGTAVADAMGVPFESMLSNNKAITDWDGVSYGASVYHQLGAGQYSDDTQMSLMVAESLIQNGGFSPDDLASRYVDWIDSGRARGYGRTTLIAINNLKAGKSWAESGVEGSYGNGTAMRAAPFGIYFRNDQNTLIAAVKADSGITHKSDEAEAGALAIALMTFAIANSAKEEDMVPFILNHMPDSVTKTKVSTMSKLLGSTKPPLEILKAIGSRADVRQTVPAALYCYFKFKNYKEAIQHAIRAGGDTDTTGAIVGALIGARDGAAGIPTEWVDSVEDKDKLVVLDSQLLSHDDKDFLTMNRGK